MAAIDMTTVAELGALLGVDPEGADAPRLASLVSIASTQVDNFLGGVLYAEGVEERMEGGGYRLYPARRPVMEVAAITIDTTTLVEDTDYRLGPDGAYIERIGAGWPRRCSSVSRLTLIPAEAPPAGEGVGISLVYSGGWVTVGQVAEDEELTETLPADIREAALQQAASLWRSAKRDPTVTSQSLGTWSESYAQPGTAGEAAALSPTALQLLGAYKRAATA